jgi:hypothetical protein
MINLSATFRDIVNTHGRESLLNQELVVNILSQISNESLTKPVGIVIKTGAAKKIAEWTESANYKASLVPEAIKKIKDKLVAAKLLSELESNEVVHPFFDALAPLAKSTISDTTSDSNLITKGNEKIKIDQGHHKEITADQENSIITNSQNNESRRKIGLIILFTSMLIGVFFPPAFIITITALPMAISSNKLSNFISKSILFTNKYFSSRFEEIGRFNTNLIVKIETKTTNIHSQASWKLAFFIFISAATLVIYAIFSSFSKTTAPAPNLPSHPQEGKASIQDEPQTKIAYAAYNPATNNLEITSSSGGSIFKTSCSQFVSPPYNKVFFTQMSGDKVHIYFGPNGSPLPHHKAIFCSSSFCWCGVELAKT